MLKLLKFFWGEYLYVKYKFLYMINPELAANSLYRKIYGVSMNIKNPRNLIEKISWLSLYTDTSLWTLCADKYRVREYVTQKGLGSILPKLYGMWQTPEEIDFNQLPQKFVLKANNGCGTVIKVEDLDKQRDNIQIYIRRMRKWLQRPFGYVGAQSHYLCIPPCIIAEELLCQDSVYEAISPSSMVDFKIWCFNGRPESILVIYNRAGDSFKMALFDTKWNSISHHLKPNKKDIVSPFDEIPKPRDFDLMLDFAATLSADFKQVRVDLYQTLDRVVFGELTFTTGYGYFTDDYYDYLGSKIEI